jgi:hypothetical protein
MDLFSDTHCPCRRLDTKPIETRHQAMEKHLMRIPFRPLIAAVALGALILGTSPCQADISLWTVSNSTVGGQPVDASALITTGAGTVDITLTNRLSPSQIISSSQMISDVRFILSNNPGTYSAGSSSATGTTGNLDSSGNVILPTTTGSVPRWLGQGPPPPGGQGTPPSVNSNGTVALRVLGGGAPYDLILPSGTSFPNANSSVIGDNPSVLGPLTIHLALSGVTAATTVTSAFISFSTQGTEVQATLVPEPSTLLIAAVGGIGFVGYGLRRRQKS